MVLGVFIHGVGFGSCGLVSGCDVVICWVAVLAVYFWFGLAVCVSFFWVSAAGRVVA